MTMAENVQAGIKNAEVFVRKLQERAAKAPGGPASGAGVSSWSSLCCSACFSSASTICGSKLTELGAHEPEVARAFLTLHDRGVAVMGEDAFMDEIIKQAKAHPPANIFETAKIK
jgi:hypothetical protein